MIIGAENGDRFGRLIAISSLAALFGTTRNEHYAATKAAINALTGALAVEHARCGVAANAILLGWIETDMTSGERNGDVGAEFAGQKPPNHCGPT
jgi:NAD(P)-dependent dehydrogenase (short-subunit alcohol dehydrogenase family)